MIALSVNVNKVATLRNSRGGTSPSVLEAVEVCLKAGVQGITVHPRADQRHITPNDVHQIAEVLTHSPRRVEFNIEGDPRPDLLALVHAVGPTQCTLVPVVPGEVTSHKGWTPPEADRLAGVIADLKSQGIRVSLFVSPTIEAIRLASTLGADRVELYTEPFARAFERGGDEGRLSFAAYVRSAELAGALGLGVNAGHDLDLHNLVPFRTLPNLAEVSIGHAIISRAVFFGLGYVVQEYLAVLGGARS
jgi:pyridoxine 5-phosphate synthase